MILSDVSVKRPVLATVMSILLVTFGAISFTRLPLTELPNTEVPIISISTTYPGASAEVVENRITQQIEQQVAGISGIDHISSSSRNTQSNVTLFFKLERDIDAAASDVRDAVARVASRLPAEADSPRISRMDADASAIMWFAVGSPTLNPMELAEYAQRYVVDRLAVLDGVAQIQGGDETVPSMRIWLNRVSLAARRLTVADVTRALRAENVEVPAGEIQSAQRNFPIRITRAYSTVEDFENLVIGQGDDGHLIKLSEVARVERAPKTREIYFRGNGVPQLGIGVVKTSTANALEVAQSVRDELDAISRTLPEGIEVNTSFDTTVFVEKAIEEVYITLGVATSLVVLVIYAFLGSMRAAFVPATVVPVCLIATFGVLGYLDYSINLMTLLGMVLCIGLVVDDSIVVLENIQRRVDQGEPPVVAAYKGARQVAFAVIATTAVIVAVFAPLVFVEGFVGRIFGELAATVTAAVMISSFVALSLSPMMCSKLLRRKRSADGAAGTATGRLIDRARTLYLSALDKVLPHPVFATAALVSMVGGIYAFFVILPQELAPTEDRGIININFSGPEGATFDWTLGQMQVLEEELLTYLDGNDVQRVTVKIPGGWGSNGEPNTGRGFIVLNDWSERDRSGQEYTAEFAALMQTIPGIRGFAGMHQGMTGTWGAPVQLVLTGPDYATLSDWSDTILRRARENRNLVRLDTDYEPTKPRFEVVPDRTRAADLGVSIQTIGETLETMMGSRRVTTFIENGEEYDVLIQGRDEDRQEPNDLTNIFVRSDRTGELIPLSNLVSIKEIADVSSRKRWNQQQSVTISSFLAPGYSFGEAIDYLENIIATELRNAPKVDYNGESRRYLEQGNALAFAFGMALLIVFLVLAAQFESFVHPFVIMLTVPVGVLGGMIGLWVVGSSLNIYSQIGMVILVGIAAKNGILIVEFANQLRDQGRKFEDALRAAAETRFRPIVMTGVSTAAGAIPLVVSSGPGAGSRTTIGVVIIFGTLISTVTTLFIVPVFYNLLARRTGSPGLIARRLAEYEAGEGPRPQGAQGAPAE